MPGIFGFISKNSKDIAAQSRKLCAMQESMMHEYFYSAGECTLSEMGLYAGWICHSKLQSKSVHIWNAAADVCLIFPGEVLCNQSKVMSARGHAHAFNPEDASFLVELYEDTGLSFLESLQGCFNGLLVDLRKKIIVLFNDRYGLGRVYYHEREDGFYFASEAKALLKILPELRQFDYKSLGEYFSCGCVLQDRSLFSNIHLLPAGSAWQFDGRQNLKKSYYFRPESWENQQVLGCNEFYEKLKSTFARVIPKYLSGPNQIGMSMTGGLDGRIIMAWANKEPGSLPCYTFGGPYRDCADVKLGRRIAQICKQPHSVISIGPDFYQKFPEYAEKAVYVSDGTMDVGGSVELYVNKLARQIAPVRLTGNYGSEIVRGNVAFKSGLPEKGLFTPDFFEQIETAGRTYKDERQSARDLSFIAFKQVPWHHYSRLSVEQSQITMRSPYLDNDIVALMYQAPQDLTCSKIPSLQLIADGNMRLAKVPTDRGILYKPIPFITELQHRYIEFTVKAEYAYDYGMPQWLTRLDGVFKPLHFEKLFLGRHKFYHFRIWYRDVFQNYIKEILLDPSTLGRPYLNGKRLETMVNNHIKGRNNHTTEIHQILSTEFMQRTLIHMK